MAEQVSERHYKASLTMRRFHKDDSFVRLLLGPIGSGKSVASCVELGIRAMAQRPNKFGYRKTRWAIIRDTYRELTDTTMKTFFYWFPEELGTLLKQNMTFVLEQKLPDGTIVHAEFLFRALDKPDDVKKLLSLELTGAWVNEAKESDKAIVDMLMGRVGRYPNRFDGGPTWHGVIMDSNCPDTDHWIYKTFEDNQYENYRVFKQPSGVSEQAENIENLPKDYYKNIMVGKDQEWINVYVHGLYGYVQDGKPVWPQYKDDIHRTEQPLNPLKGHTIYVGVDFGLTPAAVVGQKLPTGRWLILDEIVEEDMGASRFAPLLNALLNKKYKDFDVEVYGDPTGDSRVQTDEQTPFDVFMANGINIMPAYTNDIILRVESVSSALGKLDSIGNPAFCLGPNIKILRKALSGGYKYRRMQTSHMQFTDKPDKNKFSHVSDALQYLMIGAGEGGRMIESKGWGKGFKQHVEQVA